MQRNYQKYKKGLTKRTKNVAQPLETENFRRDANEKGIKGYQKEAHVHHP
jgi:hypothetical protein